MYINMAMYNYIKYSALKLHYICFEFLLNNIGVYISLLT